MEWNDVGRGCEEEEVVEVEGRERKEDDQTERVVWARRASGGRGGSRGNEEGIHVGE